MNHIPGCSWQLAEKNGISYITVPRWHDMGFINAFSCSMGGVSPHPFESLNLALHTGDSAVNVLENRRRLLELFALDLDSAVCCQQVHSSDVSIITPQMAGRGAFDYENALPACDATVCSHPGLTLMSFSADCLLLLIIDPVRRVIANAHAGWKGTWQNIASQTIACMTERYNCRPADLEVCIGPGIGPCCFEISPELVIQVSPSLPSSAVKLIEERDGHFFWDLPETNVHQLIDIGVKPENIISTSLCTSCHPELFYSFRREKGFTGRMAAFLNLVSI